jgi:hypothetical protein
MRFTRLSLGALTLLLLIAVPVNAAPALQKGSQATYSLSVFISFLNSCGPILSPSLSAVIVCPMTAMPLSLNISEALGWSIMKLNGTTVNLNVTRDISSINGETVLDMHHPGSLNESVNLATRIASIMPFVEPEIDQALQLAQTGMAATLPTVTDLSSTMTTIHDTMMHRPVYTMWWVNGPLKSNDTVPVLLFPTNVTGSTSIDLGGSIGTRSAWTLVVLNNTRVFPRPDPSATTASSTPVADNLEFAVTFNYDQTSDLLLSASADIHFGFVEETTIPCNSSASTACPASNFIAIVRTFGIDVQASLKLTSTNLDLSKRLTQTGSSQTPTSTTPPGPGSNPSTGPVNGGSGTGPTSGSNPGSGSGPTSGSQQPASNPAQSKPSTQSASLLPWIFGILGIVAAVIVAAGVWIARRRIRKATVQVATAQPTI